MQCLLDHNWGWPRKRGDRDVQVCLKCGAERQSKVRFDGPKYIQTQPGVQNYVRERAVAAGSSLRHY